MNIVHKIKKALVPSKYKITYNLDGLTTVHNNGFMLEPDFIKAEQAGAATGSWASIEWRVYTILWAASHCRNIEGDFVGCGTNKGGFAKAICEYLNFATIIKTFYLLDTFEGLDETLLTDAKKQQAKKNISRMPIPIVLSRLKIPFLPCPM